MVFVCTGDAVIRAQLSGRLQVEVDAIPTAADLNAVIAEIREKYEALLAKNPRKTEAQFKDG